MKKKPAHIEKMASDCIAVRLRLLNRVITAVYDDAMRPFGLKTSQANILTMISKMGQATPTDVCQRLHMDMSTVSRNVERMRKKGWLDMAHLEDGRSYQITVSAKGALLLKEAYPAWRAAQSKASKILGEDGVQVVSRIANSMFGKG
ncbi:hypothetical protein MNBD_NITROSPINAE01-922 [hydrothermal vent metagenome]|uniref:HTH marR-type domain-containing protein n=1 Tax=hydrothermal vent metagenome TaxID=652676 RepID=A0A3B1CMB4_9ZZZZ